MAAKQLTQILASQNSDSDSDNDNRDNNFMTPSGSPSRNNSSCLLYTSPSPRD